MNRAVMAAALAGALLVSGLIAGCSKTGTSSTAAALTSSSTGVPTTVILVSSTDGAVPTTLPETTTVTTAPTGGMAFSEYARRFGELLTILNMSHSVLGADQVASVFQALVLVSPAEAQGFRLANGDTVILFGNTSVPQTDGPEKSASEAEQDLAKAFADEYDGGRGIRFYVHSSGVDSLGFGYLVASKSDAKKLAMMALATREAPTLEDVVAQFQ